MEKSTEPYATGIEHADPPMTKQAASFKTAVWEQRDHGDESSGAIDWNVKQFIAVISLSALWVGQSMLPILSGWAQMGLTVSKDPKSLSTSQAVLFRI